MPVWEWDRQKRFKGGGQIERGEEGSRGGGKEGRRGGGDGGCERSRRLRANLFIILAVQYLLG